MRKLFISIAVTTLLVAACDLPETTNTKPLQSSPAPAMSVPPAAVQYPSPVLENFKITLKILSKECFGSAGCNITYRPQLAYGGPTLDPDITYELTYRVLGGDSGPVTATMTIVGDEYQASDEEFISTSSASKKLRVKLVSIEEA